MTIYLDHDYKCHVNNDGTMRPYEADCFNDMCQTYIEGHRLVPDGETWVREDGEVFGPAGTMISPWRDHTELEVAQAAYEKEELARLRAENADMQSALELLGVTEND